MPAGRQESGNLYRFPTLPTGRQVRSGMTIMTIFNHICP